MQISVSLNRLAQTLSNFSLKCIMILLLVQMSLLALLRRIFDRDKVFLHEWSISMCELTILMQSLVLKMILLRLSRNQVE